MFVEAESPPAAAALFVAFGVVTAVVMGGVSSRTGGAGSTGEAGGAGGKIGGTKGIWNSTPEDVSCSRVRRSRDDQHPFDLTYDVPRFANPATRGDNIDVVPRVTQSRG